MKKGKNLVDLAKEIQRQNDVKRDFIADTRSLELRGNANEIKIDSSNGSEIFQMGSTAHDQISSRLQIPKKYYDRCLSEAPRLLEENVNHWFQTVPEKRMVRTLDGRARAFLSNKYRPLDNFDLAQSVLPVLSHAGIKIESCEVTERKLYIKATTPKVQDEIVKGDVVQAGLVISNSEIGQGTLSIEPMLFRLVCENGLISRDHSLRKYHTGRRNDGFGDEAWELLEDQTKHTTDKAFWMSVRDLTKAALSQILFQKLVNKMRETKEIKIENPMGAIEILNKKYSITETEGKGILQHLIEGGDVSLYGLTNAVTRYSQDVDDYDRATDLEHLGGVLIDLTARDRKELVQAGKNEN